MPRLKGTPLVLDVTQSRALRMPRSVTASMRESIRTDVDAWLDFQQLQPQVTQAMRQSYALGYRSGGQSLPRSILDSKTLEFEGQATEALEQFSITANAEISRVYYDRLDKGQTEPQATRAALNRFNTIGMTSPGYNWFETLVRTASNAAYQQGIWDATQTDPGVWGYRFVTAADERVRHPTHTQYHLMTMPREHPIWSTVWPPLEWNCRCRIRVLRRRPRRIKRPPANPAPINSDYVGQNFALT